MRSTVSSSTRTIHRSLAFALAMCTPGVASAASLDASLDCATTTVTPFYGQTCSIDYANVSGTDLTGVKFVLTFKKKTYTSVATALPDGIHLAYSTDVTWVLAYTVSQVTGSPAPSWDVSKQESSWSVGAVPSGLTSELYFAWYSGFRFPAGDYAVTLDAYIGTTLDSTSSTTITYKNGGNPYLSWWLPGTLENDGNVIGTVAVGPSHGYDYGYAEPQTNEVLKLYLPYYDSTTKTVLADGKFGTGDTEIVDDAALVASVAYRYTYPSTGVTLDVATATATSAGMYVAPSSGKNASSVVIYDPTTKTITVNIGASETPYSTSYYYPGGTGSYPRLKYRAPLDGTLAAGTSVPIQSCYQSDQTGTVSVGDARYCSTYTHSIGATEGVYFGGSIYGYCQDTSVWNTCYGEASPIAQDNTQYLYGYSYLNNYLTTKADIEMVWQTAGHPTDGEAIDPTYHTFHYAPATYGISGRPWYTSAKVEAADVATDFSGKPVSTDEYDLTSRTIPVATSSDWESCGTLTSTSTSSLTCDTSKLSFAFADVQEVRATFDDVEPIWDTVVDAGVYGIYDYWYFKVESSLSDTMDGTSWNQSNMKGASFGQKATYSITDEDADTYTGSWTWNNETQEPLDYPTTAAAVGATSYGNQYLWGYYWYPAGYVWNNEVTTFTNIWIGGGVLNYGSEPNIWAGDYDSNADGTNDSNAHIEACIPVPEGLRFDNTVDAADEKLPVIMWYDASYGWRALATTEYTYTWTADTVDTTDNYQGELCVDIPSLTLDKNDLFSVSTRMFVVPGLARTSGLSYADGSAGHVSYVCETADNSDADTKEQQEVCTTTLNNATTLTLRGRAAMTLSETFDPSAEIGPTTEFCYDIALDSHAFTAAGSVDPSGATISSTDVAVYQWVASSARTTPSEITSAGTGKSVFTTSSSDDADAIWVHTSAAPSRGDATTLTTNGWKKCATTGGTCDTTALTALGLTAANITWVAFTYGEVLITDGEPRGTAPLDGATRVNNPYVSQLCAKDNGSADGAVIRTVANVYSAETPKSVTPYIDVTLNWDCAAGGYSIPELCNTKDDDCDSLVDEDFTAEIGKTCSIGLGECYSTGLKACATDGTLGCDATVIAPVTELCNTKDDDCDGEADEDFADVLGDFCSTGVGDCKTTGNIECSTAGGAECVASTTISPVAEACDGNDNDCDGSTDEDWTALGTACTVGAGPCEATGVWVCKADGTGAECDAVAGTPGDELCDGVDGDCDGVVDGFTDGGVAYDSCEDTDGDGLTDGDEHVIWGSDPSDADTDDDGLADGTEALDTDTDPTDDDTDGDGIQDGTETGLTTAETSDTDTKVFIPDSDPTTTTDPHDDDTDDDGLMDGTEDADFDGGVTGTETDPNNDDSDDDGIQDGTELGLTGPEGDDTDEELFVGDSDPTTTTDPNDDDTDDDGLLDGTEDLNADGEVFGTDESDPLDTDTDGDKVQDGVEAGLTKPEGTGTDLAVFKADADPTTTTDPGDPDSDHGGEKDGVEDWNHDGKVDPGECDPGDPTDDTDCKDTDGDGLSDGYEEEVSRTDPKDDDTDDDGIMDGNEADYGTDPLDNDSDDDGLQDGTEIGLAEPEGDDTNRAKWDADNDPTTTTDPLDGDTDDDGILDGNEDADHDGAKDGTETDPNDTDTDDDGLLDGTEVGLTRPEGDDTDLSVFVADSDPTSRTDPNNPDTDGDRLLDGTEDGDHDGKQDPGETDPNNPDTDGGGVADGDEVDASMDPLDPDDDTPDTSVEITRYVKGSGVIGGCDGANVGSTAGLALLAGLLIRRRRKA